MEALSGSTKVPSCTSIGIGDSRIRAVCPARPCVQKSHIRLYRVRARMQYLQTWQLSQGIDFTILWASCPSFSYVHQLFLHFNVVQPARHAILVSFHACSRWLRHHVKIQSRHVGFKLELKLKCADDDGSEKLCADLFVADDR